MAAAVHPTSPNFLPRGNGGPVPGGAHNYHRSVSPGAVMAGREAPAGHVYTPPPAVHPHVGEVLYSAEQISTRVSELARDLSVAYYDKSPVVLQARRQSTRGAAALSPCASRRCTEPLHVQ